AEQLVTELDDHQTGDFVQLVSRRLPTMTIMRMIGVPESDHERLADVAEAAVSWNDPEFLQGRNPQEMIGEVIATFHQAAIEIAKDRAKHPADDLMTAIVQAELGGQQIAKGDRVVMFYASANRDEAVFEDPDRFDVLRDPNRHLGFGGGGAHYCMGAPLAKLQMRALFTNLLRRYPDLEVDAPQYMVGN